MHIHKLDDAVVQRIAAGEVIQRPSNAIKELIENSLDAGATSITVTVQEGGYKSFAVQDNGHGILKADLALLCERYATSKLKSIEDLRDISTFGFRGEALASVSHVARISVTSKTADSPVGYKVSYLDGKMIAEPSPMAANMGTTIVVQDLFYNNPIRSNITGTARSEEYARILEVIQRYAVARAGQCAFTCKRQTGGPDLISRPNSQPIDVVRQVYGDKVAAALLPMSIPSWASGLVSNAYHQQKSFTFILFINDRLVDCPRLKRAIAGLYGEVLLTNTHPFVYLSLQLAGSEVDVNVHPTKKEVILLHEDELIAKIVDCIRHCTSSEGLVQRLVPKIRAPTSISNEILSKVNQIRPTSPTGRPPTTSLRPFQLVHTDHKRRTLDSFLYNRSSVTKTPKVTPICISVGAREQASSVEREENPFVEATRESINDKAIEPEINKNIKHLRDHLDREASSEAAEILKRHTFVGCLDNQRVFIQFDSALLLADIGRLALEWLNLTFCNRIGGTMEFAPLDNPLDIPSCLDEFFKMHPDELPGEFKREDLQREISRLLDEMKGALNQIFAIKIDQGKLLALPLVAGFNIGDDLSEASIGKLLFHLSIDCDLDHLNYWNCTQSGTRQEKEMISAILSVSKTLAEFYSSLVDLRDRDYLEHVLLPNLRKLPKGCRGYPAVILKNGTLVKAATTHELYKIFERC